MCICTPLRRGTAWGGGVPKVPIKLPIVKEGGGGKDLSRWTSNIVTLSKMYYICTYIYLNHFFLLDFSQIVNSRILRFKDYYVELHHQQQKSLVRPLRGNGLVKRVEAKLLNPYQYSVCTMYILYSKYS